MKQTNATVVFATFALVAFAAAVACPSSSKLQGPYGFPTKIVGSSGNVSTQTFEPQDLTTNPLRATFALYPTELAFGDAAYYTIDVENVSDSATEFDGDKTFSESALSECVARVAATVDGVSGEYVAAPEGAVSENALKRLVYWFRKRPEPQRAAWLFSLRRRGLYFFKNPLETKRATLYKTLTSVSPNATESTDDAE